MAEACFPSRDGLIEALSTKGKGTVLSAAYEKMNKQEPCFLREWLMRPFEFAKLKKDFFIFYARVTMKLLKFFNVIYKKDIFISPPFFSRKVVYFLSKSSQRMNQQVRAMFNHHVNIVFENGFAKRSEIEFEQITDSYLVHKSSIFYSKQDYKDHWTHQIEALTMDDFR